MVYCGKPSKGCQDCRKKRTKCDLAEPSCGQCRRTNRICQGYRDQGNLVFRDQSTVTASKYHVIDASANAPSTASASTQPELSLVAKTPSDQPADSRATPSEDPLWKILDVPVESRATCFFFANYVFEDPALRMGFNDYLPSVFGDASDDSPLTAVVTAIGLAGLGSMRATPMAKRMALGKYALALKGVNLMLQDPAQAVLDETLITIFLLSLFEMNTGRTPYSLASWARHIAGAMTLIDLRGEDQFSRPLGRRLFQQLRYQIIIGCIVRRVRAPKNLMAWTERADLNSALDGSGLSFESRLGTIGFRISQFRVEKMLADNDLRDPEYVIETMQQFESELLTWRNEFHSRASYNIVRLDHPTEEVYANYYHQYQNVHQAISWNHWRSLRILVHEFLVTQISGLYYERYMADFGPRPQMSTTAYKHTNMSEDFKYSALFRRSHRVLQAMPNDICASIPYYLSYNTNKSPWDGVTSPPVALARGNMLLWPLYMAGQMAAVDDSLRQWTVGRLRKIGDRMGIKQASMLANALARHEELRVEEATYNVYLLNHSGGDRTLVKCDQLDYSTSTDEETST